MSGTGVSSKNAETGSGKEVTAVRACGDGLSLRILPVGQAATASWAWSLAGSVVGWVWTADWPVCSLKVSLASPVGLEMGVSGFLRV